jgi:hypothetical protein
LAGGARAPSPGKLRKIAKPTKRQATATLSARPFGTGSSHQPVARPSHASQDHTAATIISGKRALVCIIKRRFPWVSAHAARVPPQKGHHQPVTRWNKHGGVTWCLKGSAAATAAVAAAAPSAPRSGPAIWDRERSAIMRASSNWLYLSDPAYAALGITEKGCFGTAITTEPTALSASVCFWASHKGKSMSTI